MSLTSASPVLDAASASPEAGSSSVTFPTAPDSPMPSQRVNAHRPFLPFRRLSLPAAPSIRDSLGSIQSFGSTPEEPGPLILHQSGASSSSLSSPSPYAPPAKQVNVSRKPRPVSMQGAIKLTQRTQVRRRRTETTLSEDKTGKRVKIVNELLATEGSYVHGLDIIYEHFLTPLMDSLDTPQPLLTRGELNSIFVNFIDIWNFHRTFYTSLSSADLDSPLAPLLSEHFPYLSLYTPFITAFPDSVAALSSLIASKPAFATFLKAQQAHPRCKMLSLRDWLLSVVQRCPRYLLLLKDLISCTEPSTGEFEGLSAVHALVSRITLSLNTSLHSHTQTLTLLAIQRSTPNLPFPLVSPGRTLLKRGNLLRVEREQRLREFLLLSDCLIWLSKGGEREWEWGNSRTSTSSTGVKPSSSNGLTPTQKAPGDQHSAPRTTRPPMGPRQRSKSDAEPPKPSEAIRELPEPSGEEKWIFRGTCDLMDIEVVTSTIPGPGEERRFDLFGPIESFAVYASNENERDAWVQAIRSAKSSLLMSLNLTHPNSTLTSSTSTAHLRRTLQAFPHHPEISPSSSSSGQNGDGAERRRKVEHFVPPVWVPDAKSEACMRCGGPFGLLRRRHHCRLCGRVVCASCSGKTFFISEGEDVKSAKPARACNACYESIFPLLPPSPGITIPKPGVSQTSEAGPHSIIRPSAMHIPTLPDIPSYRSLAPEAAGGSPRSPSTRFLRVGGINRHSFPATSSSLPSALPSLLPPVTIQIPKHSIPERETPELTRLSYCTVDTNVSTATPPMEELPHQFVLPIPIVLPPGSEALANDAITSGSPGSGDIRRRSRSSIPALRDSFYNKQNEDLPSDFLEDPSVPNTQAQNGVGPIARSRRISFAPSSAVHKAPVTIYPQKEETSRFSLVLTGKGTIGRGTGLDVGTGDSQAENGSRDSLVQPETVTKSRIKDRSGSKSKPPKGAASPLQSSESLLSTTSRSRRSIFEGLETGVAVGKLKRLLGRGKSIGSSIMESPK
ncbi:hypothetical protein FRB93_011404 [Tulasnella sp. JGI-2019a]|nr:hypothetical protein FRB93_011404 [Tulasnella sp. JGI-2019a]